MSCASYVQCTAFALFEDGLVGAVARGERFGTVIRFCLFRGRTVLGWGRVLVLLLPFFYVRDCSMGDGLCLCELQILLPFLQVALSSLQPSVCVLVFDMFYSPSS